jgi:hypothetical protein
MIVIEPSEATFKSRSTPVSFSADHSGVDEEEGLLPYCLVALLPCCPAPPIYCPAPVPCLFVLSPILLPIPLPPSPSSVVPPLSRLQRQGDTPISLLSNTAFLETERSPSPDQGKYMANGNCYGASELRTTRVYSCCIWNCSILSNLNLGCFG